MRRGERREEDVWYKEREGGGELVCRRFGEDLVGLEMREI